MSEQPEPWDDVTTRADWEYGPATASAEAAPTMSGSVQFHEQVCHLLVPIDQVTRHPENPREGDVDAIAESIEVNGFISPVIVQKSTGHIIAGNHRYDALLALGSSVIPVIQVDIDDNMAKRYLLADNRTSDLGRYNEENLAELLVEIMQSDLGLIGTGYTQDAVDALLLAESQAQDNAHFGGGTMTLLLVYSDEKYTKVLSALRAYMTLNDLGSESAAVAHMLGVD
jgi:hypothetical protein